MGDVVFDGIAMNISLWWSWKKVFVSLFFHTSQQQTIPEMNHTPDQDSSMFACVYLTSENSVHIIQMNHILMWGFPLVGMQPVRLSSHRRQTWPVEQNSKKGSASCMTSTSPSCSYNRRSCRRQESGLLFLNFKEDVPDEPCQCQYRFVYKAQLKQQLSNVPCILLVV